MTLPGFPDHTYEVSPAVRADGERLWAHLQKRCRGEERAMTSTKIAEASLMNKTYGGWFRKVVNYLRACGYPICSSQAGYWCAIRSYELDDTIAHLDGRVLAVEKARNGLRIARENMTQGQTGLRLR